MMCVQDMLYKTGYTNRPATLVSPDNTLASKVASDTLLNQNGMHGADMSEGTPKFLSDMNGKLLLSLRTSKTIEALLNNQQVCLGEDYMEEFLAEVCLTALPEYHRTQEEWKAFITAENDTLDKISAAIQSGVISANQLKKWFYQQGSIHIIPSFSPKTLLQYIQELNTALSDNTTMPQYLEQVRVIVEGCFHFDEAHDVDHKTVDAIQKAYEALKEQYLRVIEGRLSDCTAALCKKEQDLESLNADKKKHGDNFSDGLTIYVLEQEISILTHNNRISSDRIEAASEANFLAFHYTATPNERGTNIGNNSHPISHKWDGNTIKEERSDVVKAGRSSTTQTKQTLLLNTDKENADNVFVNMVVRPYKDFIPYIHTRTNYEGADQNNKMSFSELLKNMCGDSYPLTFLPTNHNATNIIAYLKDNFKDKESFDEALLANKDEIAKKARINRIKALEIIFGLKAVDATNIDQRYRNRYIGSDGFLKRKYIEKFCNGDALTMYDKIQTSKEHEKKDWIAQLSDPLILNGANNYYYNEKNQEYTREIQEAAEGIENIDQSIDRYDNDIANYNIILETYNANLETFKSSIKQSIKQYKDYITNYKRSLKEDIRNIRSSSEGHKIHTLKSEFIVTQHDLQYYNNFQTAYSLLQSDDKKTFANHIASEKPNQLVGAQFQEVLSTYNVIPDLQKISHITNLPGHIKSLEDKKEELDEKLKEANTRYDQLLKEKLGEADARYVQFLEKKSKEVDKRNVSLHKAAKAIEEHIQTIDKAKSPLVEKRDTLIKKRDTLIKEQDTYSNQFKQDSHSVKNMNVKQSVIWGNMLDARANLCFHKIMHSICSFTEDDKKIINDDPHFYDNGSDLYNKIQQGKINPTIKKEEIGKLISSVTSDIVDENDKEIITTMLTKILNDLDTNTSSKDQCEKIHRAIAESLKDMPLMYPLYYDEQSDAEYKDMNRCRELGLYLSYASDRLQTGIDDSCVKSIITFNNVVLDNQYLYEQGIGRARSLQSSAPITALEVTRVKSYHNPFKEALYADDKIFDYKARSSKFFVEQLESLQKLISSNKLEYAYTLRILSNKHIGKYLEKLQRSEYIDDTRKPNVSLTDIVKNVKQLPYISSALDFMNDVTAKQKENAKVSQEKQEKHMNAIIPLLFDTDSTKLTLLNAMIEGCAECKNSANLCIMIDFLNQLTPQAVTGMLDSRNVIVQCISHFYEKNKCVITTEEMSNIFSNTEKITLLSRCGFHNKDVLQCLASLTNEQCQLINKQHTTISHGVNNTIVNVAKNNITVARDVKGGNLQSLLTTLKSTRAPSQLHGNITQGRALSHRESNGNNKVRHVHF